MKKIFEKIWNLYKKYEEILNYLIAGGLGTVVSIATYWLFRQINLDIVVSNILSWIITVIFMYVLNRIFVFKSKSESILKEFSLFVAARIFTLVLETVVIVLCADFLKWNDIIGKVLGQIVVIVTNYALSKLIIFKKPEEKTKSHKK